jgi:methylthioribose-1-phosphate isomerase
MTERTISWDYESGGISLIDQTLLPAEYRFKKCRTVEQLAEAIRRLEVRGAPALGVAGGLGIALSAAVSESTDKTGMLTDLRSDAEILKATRPTAVNLAWGIERVLKTAEGCSNPEEIKEVTLREAEAVGDEDAAMCRMIGKNGAELLPDRCTVLTHCNAGALACSEWGTALGVKALKPGFTPHSIRTLT